MNVSKTVIVTFVVLLLISCSGSTTGSTQNDEVGSAAITNPFHFFILITARK